MPGGSLAAPRTALSDGDEVDPRAVVIEVGRRRILGDA